MAVNTMKYNYQKDNVAFRSIFIELAIEIFIKSYFVTGRA